MNIIHPNSFCGIWQIHALASVFDTPIRSLYPGLGSPKTNLCRLIMPRARRHPSSEVAYVMWTSTSNPNSRSWWEPNHFVPVFPTSSTGLTLSDETERKESEQRCQVQQPVLLPPPTPFLTSPANEQRPDRRQSVTINSDVRKNEEG